MSWRWRDESENGMVTEGVVGGTTEKNKEKKQERRPDQTRLDQTRLDRSIDRYTDKWGISYYIERDGGIGSRDIFHLNHVTIEMSG